MCLITQLLCYFTAYYMILIVGIEAGNKPLINLKVHNFLNVFLLEV